MDQRAGRGGERRRRQIAPQGLGRGHAARQQPHRGAFDIALDPGDLARKAQVGPQAQAHAVVQQRGRVQKAVAMDAAKPGKAGILQARNHPEHLRLCAVFHLGLESDDIVQRAQGIVAAQLDHGIGLFLGLVGVGQAHGLHRAVAQGLAATLCHDLDGQAAVEVSRGFALVELGLVGGQQGVDEGLVFVAVHRAVDIGLLLGQRLALVIAGLFPRDRHVDRVGMHDGRDGVKERQRLGARHATDRPRQRVRGQGPRGHDPVAVIGQLGDLSGNDGDQRIGLQRGGDRGGKRLAVHGQRAARGQAVAARHLHDQTARRAHFPMQLAHRVHHVIV